MTLNISKSLYPFTSRFATVSGIGSKRHQLHYLDEGRLDEGEENGSAGGKNEALVMIHGNPSWSFLFRDLIKKLSPTYRVVVPDHIGMGLSEKPTDRAYEYCLDSRLKNFEELIDQLELPETFTLILHDWGGMIGMADAARHPERIARLVLMNTAAFHLPDHMSVPHSLGLARTPLGTYSVRGLNGFARIATHWCVKQPLSDEVKRAYTQPYDTWKNRIGTLRFVQDVPLKQSDRSYDAVTATEKGLAQFADTPKLIVWGNNDFVFKPDVLEHWRGIWPNAEVHDIDNCGHYLMEDAPTEVCDKIASFLEKHTL